MNQVLSKPLNSEILKKLMIKINFEDKIGPPKEESSKNVSKLVPIQSKLSKRMDPV